MCRDAWRKDTKGKKRAANLEGAVEEDDADEQSEEEDQGHALPRRSATSTTVDSLRQLYTTIFLRVRTRLRSHSHHLKPTRTLLVAVVLMLALISIASSAHWASINAMSVLLSGDSLQQQTQMEALERATRQRDVEERVGRVYQTTSILAPCDPFGKSAFSVSPTPFFKNQGVDNDRVLNGLDQLFHTDQHPQPLSDAITQWGGPDSEDLTTNALALCRHFIHIHHVSIGDETVTGGRFRNPPPAHLHGIAPHTTGTDPPPIQPGEDGGVKAIIGGDQQQQNQHDVEVGKPKAPWYSLGMVGRDLSGSANPQTDILERISPVAPVVVEHSAHLLPSPGTMNLKRKAAPSTSSARSSTAVSNNSTVSGRHTAPPSSLSLHTQKNNKNDLHNNYIAQLAVPPFSGDIERIASMGIGAYLLYGENGAAAATPSKQQQQPNRSPLAGGMENVIRAMLGKPIVSLWHQIAAPFLRQDDVTRDYTSDEATASVTHFSYKKKMKQNRVEHVKGPISHHHSSYPLPPRHHHQYLATVSTHTIDLPYHSTGRILYRLKRDQLPYFNVYVKTNPLNNHPTLAIPDVEPIEHWLAQELDQQKQQGSASRFGLTKSAEVGLATLAALPPKLDAHNVHSYVSSPSAATLAPFYPEHPYQNALVDPSPWVEDNTAKRNHYFGSSKFQNFGNPVDILREQLQRQSDLLTSAAGGADVSSGSTTTTSADNTSTNNNSNKCWVAVLSPGPVSTPFLYSFEEFNSLFWGASYFRSNLPEWIPSGRTASGFVQGGYNDFTGIIPSCIAGDGGDEVFNGNDDLSSAIHAHRLRIGSLQSGHRIDTRALNRISNAGVQGNHPTAQANARAHLTQENNMYANIFSVTENVPRVISRRVGVRPPHSSAAASLSNPQQIAASLPSVTLKPPSPTLGGWDKVKKSIFTVFDSRAKLWSDQLAQHLVEATTAAEELSEIMAPLHEQESHEYVRTSTRHKKPKILSDEARGALAVALNKFIVKQMVIGSRGTSSSSTSGGAAPATSSATASTHQQQGGGSVIVNTLNHFVITCSASGGLHDALRERYFFEAGEEGSSSGQEHPPRVQLAEERLARIHSHCMGFFLDRLRTLAEVDTPKHIFAHLSAIADNPLFQTNIPTYPGVEKWLLANKLQAAGVFEGNLSGSASLTAEQYISARHLITSSNVAMGIKSRTISPSYAEQHRTYLPMHVDVLRRLSGFKLGEDGKVKFTSSGGSGDGQQHLVPMVAEKDAATHTATGESRAWIATFEKTLARLKGRAVHVFADRIPLFAGQLLSSGAGGASNASVNTQQSQSQQLSTNPNNDDPFLLYPESLDSNLPSAVTWYGRILGAVGLGGGSSSQSTTRTSTADDMAIRIRRRQLKQRVQLALRAEEAAEGRASLLTPTQRQLLIHHYSIPVMVRNADINPVKKNGGKTHSSPTTSLSEEEIVQRMMYFCRRHFVHIRFGIPKLFFKEATDNEDSIPSALSRNERLDVYDRWLADKAGIRVHVVAMPSGPSGAALNPASGLYEHVVGPALRASGFNLDGNDAPIAKKENELSNSKGVKQNVAHGNHRHSGDGDGTTTSPPTPPPPTSSSVAGLLSSKRRLLQAEEDPQLPQQQPAAAVAQGGAEIPEEGGVHRHQPDGVDNQGVGGVAEASGGSNGGRITPSPEEEARVRKEQDSHVSHEHHEASQYLREVGASMPYCALRDHLDDELTSSSKKKIHNQEQQQRKKYRYPLMWERVQQFMRSLGSDSESLRGRILHHINAELRASPMTWGLSPTHTAHGNSIAKPSSSSAAPPLTNFRLFGAPVAVSVVGTHTDRGAVSSDNQEDPLVVQCLSKASRYTPYLSANVNTSALGYTPEYQPDPRYRSLRREVMDTSEWLWSDCIHPSHSGHRLLALSTLQQLLEGSTGVVRKHINQKP
jgi:hypothetical protein